MKGGNTITVELTHLRFFAFHGLYEEEKSTGNEFEVSLKISFLTAEKVIERLQDTINYVRLHAIVQERMNHPEKLLETVAMKIAEAIQHEFSFASAAEIRIVKLHPPIKQFKGNVSVTCIKNFNQEKNDR